MANPYYIPTFEEATSVREDHVSYHFPPEVRIALQKAARTPISIGDGLARVREINAATDRARRMFPQLFRREAEDAIHRSQ